MATKKGQRRKTARRAYTGLAKRPRRFRNSPKLRKTEASLARARSALRKARAQSKSAQGPLTEAASVTAGGAVAGFAQGFYPDGLFGFDPALVGGAILVGTGVYLSGTGQVMPAKISTCLGSGMLAAWAADFTSEMFSEEGA